MEVKTKTGEKERKADGKRKHAGWTAREGDKREKVCRNRGKLEKITAACACVKGKTRGKKVDVRLDARINNGYNDGGEYIVVLKINREVRDAEERWRELYRRFFKCYGKVEYINV